MSRRGDCWDNVVAESFFATLKVELVHDATWGTRRREEAMKVGFIGLGTMRKKVPDTFWRVSC